MTKRTTTLILAFAAATTLASGAAAKTVRVEIAGFAYRPASIAVKPGDTIEWVNKDRVRHTATATDRSWEVVIPAGATGRIKLGDGRSADYFCRFHPNMRARIAGQ